MPVTPVTGKFGSAKALFLVSGYNLLAAKVQSARYKIEAINEESHGLGDAWAESTPVGVSKAEVEQQGAYWDTTLASSHDALSGSAGGARVVCLAFEGNAIGQHFTAFESAIQADYEVLAKRGALTRANAKLEVSGRAEQGLILHALTQETTDPATTEPASSVDYATDSTQRVIPITSSSVANPTTITTTVPHGLTSNDKVIISGHSGSTPTINLEYVATVTGLSTFTVPVNVTVGGTGGSFVKTLAPNGGAGYLQVTQLTLGGFTNALVKLRHSLDNSTYADLVTFAAATTRTAERVQVAGNVNRYLAQNVDFVGSGSGQSITYMAGFSRF